MRFSVGFRKRELTIVDPENRPSKISGRELHAVAWDAASSPFSEEFGDHFFSADGGLEECRHVFLDGNGLPDRWVGKSVFSIAELGFGTGLNFLETWRHWIKARRDGQHLTFTSFEAFPLETQDIRRALSVWPDLSLLSGRLLECWPDLGEGPTSWAMDGQTTLSVVHAPALDGVQCWEGQADAWYLDGFSPAKNPDMWSATLMHLVYEQTKPEGTFATYTVAGWVRRNLQAAGFDITKKPGFGRKREMMTGMKRSPRS